MCAYIHRMWCGLCVFKYLTNGMNLFLLFCVLSLSLYFQVFESTPVVGWRPAACMEPWRRPFWSASFPPIALLRVLLPASRCGWSYSDPLRSRLFVHGVSLGHRTRGKWPHRGSHAFSLWRILRNALRSGGANLFSHQPCVRRPAPLLVLLMLCRVYLISIELTDKNDTLLF